MPELTLLGYDLKTSFDELRRNLIGTSTVPSQTPPIDRNWGNACGEFLNDVFSHSSKASQSYYYKSHVQYFDSAYRSLSEIQRVLKPSGRCIIVVQDSHYKNIYNNLPLIYTEMAGAVGMQLIREERFPAIRNMAKRNPQVKKYRTDPTAHEAVLCFQK
jgi:hypothetical protein